MVMYITSRQVNFGLASNARAIMPAASGAAADVPVCLIVHLCLMSVVIISCSPALSSPLLYVVANVDVHSSRYHGFSLFSDVLLIESV